MNRLAYFILFGLILNSFGTVHSQTGAYYFPDSTYYSRGKIYLQDNVRYEVKNLKIKRDKLSFIKKIDSKEGELDLGEVYVIKAFNGTEAAKYALYGGLVSGLSAALAVASVQTDPYSESSINKEAVILGFAVGGALIGAVIGAGTTKWKTIYVSDKTSSFAPVKYKLGFHTQRDLLCLNLTLYLN